MGSEGANPRAPGMRGHPGQDIYPFDIALLACLRKEVVGGTSDFQPQVPRLKVTPLYGYLGFLF